MSATYLPVTTEAAEAIRLGALTILGERFMVLRDRAKRRELTIVEHHEISWIEDDLRTLKGMAPVSALRPARGALALGA